MVSDVMGCEHCWNHTTFYERVVDGRTVTYCGECGEEVGRKEEVSDAGRLR